ncbi:MAG: gluconokinase, GntK/IdnK-type [Trueperaceae bacterium]
MSDGATDLTFTRITERLRTADLPPRDAVDAVVAVARGGAVPGALIAYRLEKPLRLLQLSFRDDANVPKGPGPELVGALPDVRGQRIVLVDDVAVSGATLRRARDLLGAAHVVTVAFKGRPGAADVVLFPDVPTCVRWPWAEDVVDSGPAAPVRAVVVAGVSGSGKSTVGRLLAERLGWTYVEADDHHPPANVAKMAHGEPLDDDDRAPWLASLRAELEAHAAAGTAVVLSCSALKRRYRTVLTEGLPHVAMVVLTGSEALLAERIAERTGHFFDPRLLHSQLEALELPAPDERARMLAVTAPPQALVDRIVRDLQLEASDPIASPTAAARRGGTP